MRHLSYEEQIEEVQKPIYEDSAKKIWDYTYMLFKDVIKASEVSRLGREILWCIEIESKYNLKNSIFDITKKSMSDTKEFFVDYFKELLVKPDFYKPKFLIENIDRLCLGDKFVNLVAFMEDVSKKIGKDLMFLLDGGYFDQPDYCFLFNYGFMQTNKVINREIKNNKSVWVIKSYEGDDKDYVLEDMIFVWPANGGISRFLDKEGKWGFIDIVSFQRYYMPDYVRSMNDCKYDRAAYYDKRKGLYGYINCKGEIVISPKYINAMDFMYFRGEILAVVQYSMDEEYKLRTDSMRKNIMGENEEMGITIFKDLITIDINGNFTNKIQERYDEEKKRYYEKIETTEQYSDTLNYVDYSDDEEDIMNALENGYGDIYGF